MVGGGVSGCICITCILYVYVRLCTCKCLFMSSPHVCMYANHAPLATVNGNTPPPLRPRLLVVLLPPVNQFHEQ